MMWLFLIAFVAIASILSVQFFNILIRHHPPLISTPAIVRQRIMQEISLQPHEVFYELGSGKALLLNELAKLYPDNSFAGIDYALVPYALSLLKRLTSNNAVILRRQNCLKTDIRKASYIYCYLNIHLMDALAEKFQRECTKGTIIISYIFILPNFQLFKSVKVEGYGTIYFYRIS